MSDGISKLLTQLYGFWRDFRGMCDGSFFHFMSG